KLIAVVRHLAVHTPFYVKYFEDNNVNVFKINGVEDWQKLQLPLIRKVDYMNNPKDFIVSPSAQEAFSSFKQYHSELDWLAGVSIAFRGIFGRNALKEEVEKFFFPKMPLFSGGTEYGAPVPVFLTGDEKQQLEHMIQMITEHFAGLLPKERPRVGMNLFPYGPHLAWHAAHMALDNSVDLNLCTAAGGAIPTERLVALAGEFKPTVFTGMAEYFRHRFLEVCKQKKVQLPQKSVFVHGATMLLDSERALLKEAAKSVGVEELAILNLFGASELKTALLPECDANTGFHHVAPLAAIIRTAQIESLQKYTFTPGNGQMVVWTTSGAGTLLLGYLLGDNAGRVETTPCPSCKLRVQRFFNVTRAKDVEAQLMFTGIIEEKVKGARLNLVGVRDKVLAAGAKECQITVDAKKLVVSYAGEKHTAKKIQEALSGLEVKPVLKKVSLQTFLKQPGFKFKPIIVK
ncbi:MAG: hypothetical protein HY363_01170, partial [Candidatus Aenigmarchaeota archaeon]|nr:hypothetical protein [Candidatus Aenigmarchaeota archaeon]